MNILESKFIHHTFYGLSFFIVVSVFTMPISLVEKGIHTFSWIYLVLAYAYFFDGNPPKCLRVKSFIDAFEKETEFLDDFILLTQETLNLMRKIQLHEDFRIVNQSIEELNQRYKALKRLTPPIRYQEKYDGIMREIDGFLDGLLEGDYYLVQTQTK